MQTFKCLNDAFCKQVQTISIHLLEACTCNYAKSTRLPWEVPGAKLKKNSNRGSHFQKKKQIISNDHNYFKTLPSEPAIELSLSADEEDTCVETETEWREGRRIVELGHLAKQFLSRMQNAPPLKRHCVKDVTA